MKQPTTKWVLGHMVTPYDTAGNYDLMMAETPPHVPGPPPHLHTSYKEAFLIVEGEMEFMINGELQTVKAGESIDVPPNTLHTFNNRTDKPCKWINIHSPKGFRDFFETLGVPADEDNAVERSVSDEIIQQVIQTAADYDMHIPPPPQ
jgi:mannose-6-phosphate isomerase-like protein (cupin superfamily)